MESEEEIIPPRPHSSLKLWLICLGLCAGNGVPFFSTLYIPNTAQAAMSGFLARSALGVENGTAGLDEESSVQLSLLWSLFIAEMAVGQLIGYLLASPIIDRVGRRRALLGTSLLQIPFQACHIGAQPLGLWQLLYVGRGGAMILFAIASVAAPVFLNEISPPAKRGALGTCFPLSLSLGALLGGFLGLHSVLGSPERWPFAFIVPLSFSMLEIPLLLALPESPTFLAGGGQKDKAKTSLVFFQGSPKELAAVCEESQSATKRKASSGAIFSLIKKQSLRGPMTLTLVISATFTFSGIAIVSAYSTALMERSGLGWRQAEWATVGLKLLSFSTYLVCLFLVDRVGRRALMLCSITGSALAWSSLVASDFFPPNLRPILLTALLYAAQLFMNIGIRPLFYVLVPELYPFHYRTAGKSLAALVGVLMAIPLLFLFWPAFSFLGSPVLLVHAVPLVLGGIYLFFALPETKGRHSQEIWAQLRISSVKRRQWVSTKDPRPEQPIPVAL